jgi:ElaB/YqjD/DUF883 family membrane-anchored ribosome-binding protein
MTNEQSTSYPMGQPDTRETNQIPGSRTEEPRQRVAGGLDRAASTIRERATSLPGGQKVSGMARTAADRLETAASYVRDHDAKAMADDARHVVRQNPAGSMLAACAAGFVVGFLMRRR